MLLDAILDAAEPYRYDPLLEPMIGASVVLAPPKQTSTQDLCENNNNNSSYHKNRHRPGQAQHNGSRACCAEKAQTEDEGPKYWQFTWRELKWSNVILITVFHLVALVGFLTFPYIQKLRTFLWSFLIGIMAAFGVTGGVHRFWTHRSYKAKLPLRIFLMVCYVCAGQNSIFQWVRDHRVHHKFSETDADPHNANRGFFFSHVGWLMLKKHPDVLSKGKTVDMSDILADPVVRFEEKYFIPLKLLICFVIPIAVPIIFWQEEFYYAFLTQISRYIYVLNATWSVNSFAHIWGNKPYNRNIAPVENRFVSWATFGEGWHNYHHCFPMDYRAAEIGGGRFNTTTSLINLFAKIGWAYELREPSESVIRSMILNKGDGTHETLHQHEHHKSH